MPFVIEESGIPDVTSDEEFFLSCLLNVYSPPSALTTRRLRGRLFVDAAEIPFKRAEFSDNGSSSTISIELVTRDHQKLFTRTASIKLEAQEFLTGSWGTVKTYCDGAILATSNYQLQNQGNNPNDTFSVTVQSVLQQKLNLTPEQFVVLFDPAKTAVVDTDLEVVPNIDGTVETPTVTPVSGLNLGDVFQFLADLYELDGYITNINYEPWKLSRVDFPPAQPYWNTVAGIIGNHSPRVSIKNNKLVIEDGTLTDYISARTMTLANFSALTLNNTIERFKGCKLDRQLRLDGWDYYELRQEIDYQYFGGVSGAYPLNIVTTWYQDFYRNSFPNVPVLTQVFSTKELEYSDGSTIVSARQENFSYNFGQSGIRPSNTTTREWGWANVPASWTAAQATLPGPNSDFAAAGFDTGLENSYTATNGTGHTEALVLTRTSKINYTYASVPKERDSVYAKQTDTETRGLITRDTENQQLGQDFEQDYIKAQESGNVAEGQDSYWGTTDYSQEAQAPERPRKVSLKTRERTPLNSTGGLSRFNHRDRRIGDIGESEIQVETKPIYITEGGDPTATLWRNVTGGEAPIVVLQPLCHRLNKSQDFPGGINAELPYYDETMDIGLVFDPQVDGRAASSLGIFVVESYTDTLSNVSEGGFKTVINQARQIA